ncbi:MAG: hypothetical protein HGA47_00995 [Zoogloea sp.]|nr:hypothetical protein [Zoogloea sp.]
MRHFIREPRIGFAAPLALLDLRGWRAVQKPACFRRFLSLVEIAGQ